jgi:hypothetical protein
LRGVQPSRTVSLLQFVEPDMSVTNPSVPPRGEDGQTGPERSRKLGKGVEKEAIGCSEDSVGQQK